MAEAIDPVTGKAEKDPETGQPIRKPVVLWSQTIPREKPKKSGRKAKKAIGKPRKAKRLLSGRAGKGRR